MDAQSYLQAAEVFRSVLDRVQPDQLHNATLCALEISRTQLVPLRGEDGFFGPEFVPPAGSPTADVLAGFLGRSF